jgi:CHAT domain-containing protein
MLKNDRLSRATSRDPGSPPKATLSAPSFSCGAAFGSSTSWPLVAITGNQVSVFRAAIPGLKVLQREQATEAAVKQINRPRSLWFITHGFFCEDASGGVVVDSLQAGRVRSSVGKYDDPMSRAALVLAGAQVGGTGDGEDGFLQGSEIVERDWEGTELVVLGACETALGVPKVGDGVYGMRRALALAGVRSQVMTLWRVSQAQTFELLQTFANQLKEGKGKAEALRAAQQQMLRKYPHPYYWAGFYFIGDPAPLAAN